MCSQRAKQEAELTLTDFRYVREELHLYFNHP